MCECPGESLGTLRAALLSQPDKGVGVGDWCKGEGQSWGAGAKCSKWQEELSQQEDCSEAQPRQ